MKFISFYFTVMKTYVVLICDIFQFSGKPKRGVDYKRVANFKAKSPTFNSFRRRQFWKGNGYGHFDGYFFRHFTRLKIIFCPNLEHFRIPLMIRWGNMV